MNVARGAGDIALERVWGALADIADPEIPAISLVDLGVIGSVSLDAERVRVEVLPTFVGCPAIDVMRTRIAERLEELAVAPRVEVDLSYTPPWTSERITPRGRERLRASGFAPPVTAPGPAGASGIGSLDELTVLPIAECPYCGSRNTALENPFGPTLCRATYHCADCRQPFEQMKRV